MSYVPPGAVVGTQGPPGPQGPPGAPGATGAPGAPGADGAMPSLVGIQDGIQWRSNGASHATPGDITSVEFVGAGVSAVEDGNGGLTVTVTGSSGPWTVVKQAADQSKTDNALTASSGLTIALSAATHYVIRGTVYLLVQNAAADARFDLNYSGTWTSVYCKDSRNVAGVAAGASASLDRMGIALPGNTDMLSTVTGVCVVEFELNGLTNASGTFAVRFAQVTNNASATLLKKGSYLEWMTV